MRKFMRRYLSSRRPLSSSLVRGVMLCLFISIRWHRQPQMIAQRAALIFGAEQAASLQLRHHQINEIIKSGREVGWHDVETIGSLSMEPFFQCIGNVLRRAADDAVTACTGHHVVKLA